MTTKLVGAVARRPWRVLLVAVLVAVVGALLALRLEPSAATDTLVGRGTDSFQATEKLYENFGDEPVAVLVQGSLQDVVLSDNINKLVGLEGCLSGVAPPADVPVPGGADSPCGRLAATQPVQVVFGPATFINTAVSEISAQLQAQLGTAQTDAQAAREQAQRAALRAGASEAEAAQAGETAAVQVQNASIGELLRLATQYGIPQSAASDLTINNEEFVYALVFEPTSGSFEPKSRFAYLFPSPESALIQVRLKPGLSDDEREAAIGLVRAATEMPEFKLTNASYLVSGAPVLVEGIADSLSASLIGLLIGGLIMMALVLPLVFRGARFRMLPLAVALGAAGIVGGLMSLLGIQLTLASMAVLPVLLGLGVDYAIQYQARVQEDGVVRAVRVAVPTIAIAVLATVAGFAVLLLSPVPMVRGFGIVLMLGVVIAYLLALTAGTAALALLVRRRPERAARASAAMRGAREMFAGFGRPLAGPAGAVGSRVASGARRVTALSLRRPVLVLGVGFALAVGGWVVDSRTEVVSDVVELVPEDLPVVRDVLALQDETGIAGEVDVLVEAEDLTEPAVVQWMQSFQERVKERFDYSAENGCGEAELCPAVSLVDLFRSPEAAADQERIRALLDAVPEYFSRAVISTDRRSAVMSFGIKLLPLAEQEEALDVMRSELDPPDGVTARLAGLPVLAAEANAKLSDPARRLGTLLAGLAVVALALLAVYRRWERAWVPLVPIALATGWSALVLWIIHVPLNPMSATLGALVIAISTEFAVLLVARFHEERATGLDVAGALARTYASTGAAVLASGATAIAGFAVLAFSDVTMLRDFGRVTVIDLSVSLLGVLAVLPAVLVLAERRRARRADPATSEPVIPA
ncbi:MAG: MMPL family transporter [Solirubrobacteraceae bacterium]